MDAIKRRNCYEVITEMILKIPEDKIKLIKDLKWNYEDSLYKALEETLQWQLLLTPIKHIPEPSHDWEFEILSIFSTIPVNMIKKSLK